MKVYDITTRDVTVSGISDYPFLCEFDGGLIERDHQFLLKISGRYYKPILFDSGNGTMGVRAINGYQHKDLQEETDQECPRCPNCGRVIPISDEHTGYPVLCAGCGATLSVEKLVSVSYTTMVIETPLVITVSEEGR